MTSCGRKSTPVYKSENHQTKYCIYFINYELNYKGQNLFIDNISIKGIANKNITPFYVYSYKKIKDNFQTFYNNFKK